MSMLLKFRLQPVFRAPCLRVDSRAITIPKPVSRAGSHHVWKKHARNPWGNFARPTLVADKAGKGIIDNPLTNKGTAFSQPERDRIGIRGLVPPRQMSMKAQIQRVLRNYHSLNEDLDKYLYLTDLQDRNETLYYKVLIEHIEEMAPVVYTPTVGAACMQFGNRFRRPRGMYFSAADRGQMAAMVYNWPSRAVDVIVVTDGSRILGLGDLGTNGMAIPIGKLALYVAAGGVDPSRVMPVMLDVGTNNENLLQDPFYLGLQHRRLEGDEYYAIVDEFLTAVRYRWPHVLVQFEDFASVHASTVLKKYKDEHLCFNDDIQGTGAVVLGATFAALKAKGLPATAIKEQRVMVVGAGSAGVGVSEAIAAAMEQLGLSSEAARANFYLFDKDGLLGHTRKTLNAEQRPFARKDLRDGLQRLEAVKDIRPTILLGLSSSRGIFTKELLKEVSKHQERPIIFSLSNPTANSECTAEQAYEWTEGKAIFASGSPFRPVHLDGKTFIPSQANNMYIFPGVGLGGVLSGARILDDSVFLAAARTLGDCCTPEMIAKGQLLPDVKDIRGVSHAIACSVIEATMASGAATINIDRADIAEYVEDSMYAPEYAPLVPVPYLDDGNF